MEEESDLSSLNAQYDLNRKQRDDELAKLKKELAEANAEHETSASQMKRKHKEAVAELSEQLEQLQKNKIK